VHVHDYALASTLKELRLSLLQQALYIGQLFLAWQLNHNHKISVCTCTYTLNSCWYTCKRNYTNINGKDMVRIDNIDPPWCISVHDESHDGLEVVPVEGDLRLLGHVHVSGVPGSFAVPQSLHPLTTVGGLERVSTPGKTKSIKYHKRGS
jgi:hypothetical protein